MSVKELIEKLQQMPPSAEACIAYEGVYDVILVVELRDKPKPPLVFIGLR